MVDTSILSDYNEHFKKLIHLEGLDDPSSWTERRHYDEIPFCSGINRITFLSHLPRDQIDEILVIFACLHLDKIASYLVDFWKKRDYSVLCEIFICLTILDLKVNSYVDDEINEMPADPCFFITSYKSQDWPESRVKLQLPFSPEGIKVQKWLKKHGLVDKYDVLEERDADILPDVGRRVFVGHKTPLDPLLTCLSVYCGDKPENHYI